MNNSVKYRMSCVDVSVYKVELSINVSTHVIKRKSVMLCPRYVYSVIEIRV
jgi:hypothetical protein